MGPRKKLKVNKDNSPDNSEDPSSQHSLEVESTVSNSRYYGSDSGSEAIFNSASSQASTVLSSVTQLEIDNEKLRQKVAQLESQINENQKRSTGSESMLQKFGLEFANAKSSHLTVRDGVVCLPFEYFCIGQRSKDLLITMPKFSGMTVVGKKFCATSNEFNKRPISINVHIVWLTRYYYAVQAKEFTVINHAKLQRTMVFNHHAL